MNELHEKSSSPKQGATLKDIARRLAISESTVSRALSGRSSLKPETVRSVKRVAREIGYVPSVVGRGLALQKTGVIGVALPTLDYAHGDFYSAMMRGVELTSSELGYSLLYITGKDLAGPRSQFQAFLDGLIVLGPVDRYRHWRDIAGKPLVFLDRSVPDWPSISSENRKGATAVARHLADLGHRRILVIAGPERHPSVVERIRGIHDALDTLRPDLALEIIHADWTQLSEPGRHVVDSLFARSAWNFTAVIGMNDVIAIGAMLALQEHGLIVPRDVSITGFDDAGICRLLKPALTSVRQNPDKMGVAAVRYLHGLITEKPVDVAFRWETDLVVRESTGRAPG